MKFMKIFILVLFFISLLPQTLLAEGIRKIAYINVSKVFDSYYKTKEADEKLEKEGKKKNAKRDKLINEINKLRDEVELLSKKAGEEKEIKLNEKVRALQDFDREARLELRRKRDDMMREIVKEIDEEIKDYGKNRGYDIIFDDRILLYADEGIDITDKIIGVLNKR